jgi:cell division protein FtsI/penicillin-binding protein 2
MANAHLFRPGQLRWLLALTCALVLALAGLGYRLVLLQVVRHEELRALASSMMEQTVVREPWRGEILDANGNPLALSHPIKRVCANPVLVGEHRLEVARLLSPLLGTPEAELADRLRIVTRVLTNGLIRSNQFVDLRREVTLEQWLQITQAMSTLRPQEPRRLTSREQLAWEALRTKAVFGVDSQRRHYPNGELAAHVIGITGVTNYTVYDTWVRELVGFEGIEATFNKDLSGVFGIRVTERDRKNVELTHYRGQDAEPKPGLNVVLTLDLVLQRILEVELAEAANKFNPVNAMGLIVRPRTGEILAMANRLTFNPNDLRSSPIENRRNHIISDFYEPGSTFKVVSLSAALGEGVTRLSDIYDCEHGTWHYAGHDLTDHEHYGALPLEIVFAKSSNIGIAKMALRMQPDRFYRYVRDFGFGSRTGIELPGEAHGRIREPSRWQKTSMTRIPIGYEVAATPLQMTMAVAAIANQGMLMRPQIVKRLQDQRGNVVIDYQPVRVRQVLPPETVRQVVTAMKTVVSTNGTGLKAILDHYTAAGKTGTAWKWNTNTMRYDKRYYSSFIGFFPADQPELVIGIIVDQPQFGTYGGQVAAPVFRKVAEQAANYLKIPPDRGILAAPAEDPRVGVPSVAQRYARGATRD